VKRLAWIALVLLIGGEGIARFSGIADVPLYRVDDEIGYIPAPNQSGAFLRRNDWVFNERSMGARAFAPEGKKNVLLLGDSIVYGGDAYRQREKLGPRLEETLGGGYAVWPVGAGRWSALNETTYLQRNADLPARMETLVWVLITVDFERRMQSWSPLIHPQKPPLLAGVFGLRRFILPRLGVTRDPAFPPLAPSVPIDNQFPLFDKYLSSLRASNPRLRILLVLYPSLLEGAPAQTIAGKLGALASRLGIGFFRVAKEPRWNSSYYRDVIHPSAAGNVVLANLVKEHLEHLSR